MIPTALSGEGGFGEKFVVPPSGGMVRGHDIRSHRSRPEGAQRDRDALVCEQCDPRPVKAA